MKEKADSLCYLLPSKMDGTIMHDFSDRYHSAYFAWLDRKAYLEAKGYRFEGDRYTWEPLDEIDLEPVYTEPAPGAMRRGELELDFSEDCNEPLEEF